MRKLWLFTFILLLAAGPAAALQLHWSTGADTMGTVTARRAVFVVQPEAGEGALPRECRLLWAADNIQLAITPLDSAFACYGDTAQVFGVIGPSTSEEIASHLSVARFCSGGIDPAALAAWVLDLPAGARGKLMVYAFDPFDPTTVLASGTISFGQIGVLPFTPNVTVSVSPNPSYAARSATLKAVVVPISSGGLVTFKDGNTVLGTSTVAANGISSLVVSGLALGAHTIVASFDTVSSLPVTHVVNPLEATTTSLTTTPNPSRHQASVILAASVTPSASTGMITFTDGGVSLGNATLIGGTASITVSSLSAGTHMLAAAYAGDVSHESSVSASVAHEVTPLVSTVASLSASPDSVVAGQGIGLKASLTPASASGTVDFRLSGSLLGSAPLVNGEATLPLSSVCGGVYSYSVSYGGDSLHYGSSASLEKQVGPVPIHLTVTSTQPSSRYTEAVHFLATAFDSSHVDCQLAGTVQFFIDGVAFGPPVSLSDAAAASPSISTLTSGQHLVHASFSGNVNFQAAISAPIIQDVELPNPKLISVRDVTGDQGGWVKLSWTGSYLDLAPFNLIDSYWVLRSVPASVALSRMRDARAVRQVGPDEGAPAPGTLLAVTDPDTSYYWEFLSSQPAFHVTKYSYTAPTTRDSVAGSNPMTAFMIIARTAAGAAWWFSNPDSGYSVDNLAPARPDLNVLVSKGVIAVATWDSSRAADFTEYRLHWGATADFVPSAANLAFRGRETRFTEPARGLQTYYKLSAVDVHGNESPFATAIALGVLDGPDGQSLAFGLGKAWPNPVRGDHVSVELVLTRPEFATLDVLDVTGRRVAGGDLRALTAGRHQVEVATGGRLAPGLYLVRLAQGSESRVSRFVVLD